MKAQNISDYCVKKKTHLIYWNCGTVLFSFIKDVSVYTLLLKEVIKEALKHPSLAFKEFKQLLLCLPHRHLQVISISNLHKKKNDQSASALISLGPSVDFSDAPLIYATGLQLQLLVCSQFI